MPDSARTGSVARLRGVHPPLCVTHAHTDHAGGLANGSPRPVYATRRPGRIGRYPIEQRRTIQAKQPFRFDSVIWQASALSIPPCPRGGPSPLGRKDGALLRP